jgi:LPS export ABC transporter protein LptC
MIKAKKRLFLWLIGVLLVGVSCKSEVDPSMFEIYTGPSSIRYDVNLYHSDSAIVRIQLKAKKQLAFDTGDFEFPDGIDITFFDELGEITTTIRADKGYYMRNKHLYRGEGDVQVKNIQKDQSLSSEEMYWDPNGKKIYTDKFVTIIDKQTLIKGTGMEADEGFNEYKIFKPFDSRMIIPGEN